MDRISPLDILADAFYNNGVEPEDAEDVAQSVLDELSKNGYVVLYSERVQVRNGSV